MTSTANDQCFWVFCFCFLDFPTYFSLKYIFLIWREKCFIKILNLHFCIFQGEIEGVLLMHRFILHALVSVIKSSSCCIIVLYMYHELDEVNFIANKCLWHRSLFFGTISYKPSIIYIFLVYSSFFFILSQKFSEDWKVLNAYYIFWWINYVHLYNYI